MSRPRLTRRLVAAWLFDTRPRISDEDLNRILRDIDLPNDRFQRKDGSHYRRLHRQGRLPPPPDSDPRDW